MDLLLNCAGRSGDFEEEYFSQRGRPEAGAPRAKLRRSKSLGKGSKTPRPQWQAGSASRVVQSVLDENAVLREENLRLRREKEYNRASLVFNHEQERALAANLGLKLPPYPSATRPDSLALPGTSTTTLSQGGLHYAVGNVGSTTRGRTTPQGFSQPYARPNLPSSATSAQQQQLLQQQHQQRQQQQQQQLQQHRLSQIYAIPHASNTSSPQTPDPIYATPYVSGVTSAGYSRNSSATGVTSPRSSMVLTSQNRRGATPACTPQKRDLPPIPLSQSGTLRSDGTVDPGAPNELPAVPVPQISMPNTLGSQCSGWSEDSGFREPGDCPNTSHYETLDHFVRKGQSLHGCHNAPRRGLTRSQSMKSPTSSTPGSGCQSPLGRQESMSARPRISMGISAKRSSRNFSDLGNNSSSSNSSNPGSPVEAIPRQLEALTELLDELTLSSVQDGHVTRGQNSADSAEDLKQCLGSLLAPQLADLSRQFHTYREEQKERHERLLLGQQRIVELTLQSKAKVTAVQNDLMKLIGKGKDEARDHSISEDVSKLPEYITGVGLTIQDKFGIRERVGDFFRQLMNPAVVDYICLQQQELSPRALFWRLLCELSRLLEREGKDVSLISMLTACEACKITPLQCKLMPRRHQEVVNRKYSYLVDNLIVSEVLPYLHDSGLLTSELQGYVMEGKTEKGRVTRLISVLPVLGEQAFPLLLSALAASEQSFIEKVLRDELSRQITAEEQAQQAALARSLQDSLLAQSPDGSGQTVLSRLAGVLETSGSSSADVPNGASGGAGQLAILQILAALRANIKDLQAVCLQNSEALALLHRERSQTNSDPNPLTPLSRK